MLVGEGRFFFLEMGRVRQHDLQQVRGAACAIDGAREAVPDQSRQIPGVIDVRVAQHDRAERARIGGGGAQLRWRSALSP